MEGTFSLKVGLVGLDRIDRIELKQFGVSPPCIAAARERGSVILVEIVDLLHGRLARGAQAPAPGAGAFLSAPFCRRHSSQLDGERAGVILVDMS